MIMFYHIPFFLSLTRFHAGLNGLRQRQKKEGRVWGWGGGGKGGVEEYAGKRPWGNIVMLLHLVTTCWLLAAEDG